MAENKKSGRFIWGDKQKLEINVRTFKGATDEEKDALVFRELRWALIEKLKRIHDLGFSYEEIAKFLGIDVVYTEDIFDKFDKNYLKAALMLNDILDK